MARPRKNPLATPGGGLGAGLPAHLSTWAEALGEALGRGVARGINLGLAGMGNTLGGLSAPTPGRRGRPPKLPLYPVPADRRCKVDGCPREARSKGLCSAHYQAERRRQLEKK